LAATLLKSVDDKDAGMLASPEIGKPRFGPTIYSRSFDGIEMVSGEHRTMAAVGGD
jgi:hypothetical protein